MTCLFQEGNSPKCEAFALSAEGISEGNVCFPFKMVTDALECEPKNLKLPETS